jgi:uncharacterized protein
MAALCCVALWFAGGPAVAKDATAPIVIRAGKNDSPNHALARQFAEAVAAAVSGTYTLDVQESQGSVQNVIDAVKAPGNFLFTAGPNVIAEARRGEKPFAPDKHYRDIRALFPIPAQTLHWVVRADSPIKTPRDLASHNFIAGAKGSISERLTVATLQALSIDHQVQLMDIDANAAPAALKANQASGIALAGAYPLPILLELARTTPIRLLSLPQLELAKMLSADDSTAAVRIPKGTYPGVDEDVTTLAIPAGVYTTRHMPAATAYAITKAFWTQHAKLAQRNPPWSAITPATLAQLKVKLHKGALRYYAEAKIKVPAALR